VIFLSGDDAEAKSDVVALFEQAGFSVIDLGGLRDGGRINRSARRWPANLIRLP
jgi:predicted dinucleotide-binding enzyme